MPSRTAPRDTASRRPARSDTASSRDGETDDAALFKPPLAPRRTLLVGLSITFAAWIAFLLVLYFMTASARHASSPVETNPAEAPSPPLTLPAGVQPR